MDIRIANGIKPLTRYPRFDGVAIWGRYQALKNITNARGLLYFYLMPGGYDWSKNMPEYSLQTTRSINFTGLYPYIENGKASNTIFCGFPSSKPLLRGNRSNPFYDVRNDGFLVIISEDTRMIEILIVENGKQHIEMFREQLATGKLSEVLKLIRCRAKPFVKYKKS